MELQGEELKHRMHLVLFSPSHYFLKGPSTPGAQRSVLWGVPWQVSENQQAKLCITQVQHPGQVCILFLMASRADITHGATSTHNVDLRACLTGP